MAASHFLLALVVLVILSPAVDSASGSCKLSGTALGVSTRGSGSAYLTITYNQTATIKLTVTSLKNFFMAHLHQVINLVVLSFSWRECK